MYLWIWIWKLCFFLDCQNYFHYRNWYNLRDHKSVVMGLEIHAEESGIHTFLVYAWFQTQGRDVHVKVEIPSLTHASTLKSTAATCEHTSPKLSRQNILVYQLNIHRINCMLSYPAMQVQCAEVTAPDFSMATQGSWGLSESLCEGFTLAFKRQVAPKSCQNTVCTQPQEKRQYTHERYLCDYLQYQKYLA